MEGNGLCFLRWKLIRGRRRERERKKMLRHTTETPARGETLNPKTLNGTKSFESINLSISVGHCSNCLGLIEAWIVLHYKIKLYTMLLHSIFFVHLLRAIELSRRCATSARSKPTKISPNCRSENSNFDINEFDYTLQIASNLKFYIWKKKANLETIMKLSHARSLQMRLKWPEKNV